MSGPREKIMQFLKEYAKAALAGDADRIAGSYHSTYIEASPASVMTWVVDQNYRKALTAQSSAMRDQLGLNGLDIDLRALHPIGSDHFLAEAQWTMSFDVGAQSTVSRFLISYLIRLTGGQPPLILAYVSHEDQQAVMQRDGVVSPS